MDNLFYYKLGQKAGGGSGGGAVSWNDLTDKPFYEEAVQAFKPIVYDNNKEYTTVATINSGAGTFDYYKCADYITLTDENFGSMTVDLAGNITVVPASAAKLCVYEHGWECFDSVMLASDGQQTFGGIILPEGIWVREAFEIGLGYLVIYPAATNIKTLDSKYLEFMESKDILPTQAVKLYYDESGLWQTAYGDNQEQVIAMSALRLGETYKVAWQGQEYACEAFDVFALMGSETEGLEGKCCALGNASFFIPDSMDTGEPFYVHYVELVDTRQVLIASKSSAFEGDDSCLVTMRVSRMGEGYKIKPEYLPTLTSPSGKKFKITVDDSGTLSAAEVTE